MGHRRIFRASVRFAALFSGLFLFSLPVASQLVRFRGIADGTDEARGTGKPMLIFFSADWCAKCDQLRDTVFRTGAFAAFLEDRYVPIEVVAHRREKGANPPDVQAFLDAFAVRGYPTLVVARAGGRAALRQSGFASREQTLMFLREAPSRLQAAEEKQGRAKDR